MSVGIYKPPIVKKEVNQDKLHWEVKHKTSFKDEDDFLETILVDYGINRKDIPNFLNPTRKLILNPMTMKNMKEVVELIHKHVQNKSKIAILPDSDNDGMCVGSLLGQWLQNDLEPEIPPIQYVFNEGKVHGLTYDLIKNFKQGDIDLFIIPDASTTCKEAILIKKNFPNMDLLCIDHHLFVTEYFDAETNKWITQQEADEIKEEYPERIKEDIYTNYVLTVNCTDGQYENPTLCGTGVAQKVIEAYYDTYPQECVDECIYKYLDLVSIAECGDGMDLRNLETRYYVIEGMKKGFQNNKFFNELQERLKDEMPFGRYIESASWQLVPKVNGVIRFGKEGKKGELSEREKLFYAMLNTEGTVEYKPRRKSKNDPEPEIEIHSLAWDAARMAVNVKARQDTEVRKYFKQIQEEISEKELDKNTIIFVDGTDILERGETSGLVANKLVSTYFRPVVLMREFDSQTYGGSARGYDKSNIKDLNSVLSKYGIECRGHSNAHGVQFKKEDLNTIIENINKDYPLDELYVTHKVDWEIPANKLKRDYVQEVAQQYELWGNTVPVPTFLISNLVINVNEINGYGDYNTFIRFIYKGVTFVKKYCKVNEFDKMICKTRTTIGKPNYKVKLNVICQFVLNVWEDKVNPEVKILYFDSVKYNENDLDFDFDIDEDLNKNNNKKTEKINNIKINEKDKINNKNDKINEDKDIDADNINTKIIKEVKKNQFLVKMQKVDEDIDINIKADEQKDKQENEQNEKENTKNVSDIDKKKKKEYTIDDDFDF